MKKLTIILLLISAICQGQSLTEPKYDWDYVIKHVRKNKMNATKGTEAIISEIVKNYKDDEEQMELIRLYKEAYDYQIVDKALLKKLVDSLAINGLNERVKSLATESKNFVEYRLLNKKIKDFEFPDKDGKVVKLTALNKKIVIIELWATWCGPCIKEMKKIRELKTMNPYIEFYSISVDKSSDRMKKFIDKNNYDWPIVFGGDQELNKELWDYLNIVAIPKYYTVDREGIVINVAGKLDEEYIKSLK